MDVNKFVEVVQLTGLRFVQVAYAHLGTIGSLCGGAGKNSAAE